MFCFVLFFCFYCTCTATSLSLLEYIATEFLNLLLWRSHNKIKGYPRLVYWKRSKKTNHLTRNSVAILLTLTLTLLNTSEWWPPSVINLWLCLNTMSNSSFTNSDISCYNNRCQFIITTQKVFDVASLLFVLSTLETWWCKMVASTCVSVDRNSLS